MKKITTIKLVTLVMAAAILLPSYVYYKKHKINNRAIEPATITVNVQQVADNLQGPTAMAFPGNGIAWVTEQTGKIRQIKDGKITDVTILDLHDKLTRISPSYEERGLLGIALHPKFNVNKKFYVFYSTRSTAAVRADHTGVVAEYQMQPNSDQADPNSGRIILTIQEPESNHNGGCIQFGSDGYLYVSFGDGGGQGDKHGEFGNGQKMDTWLGKILRVDINTESGYKIPADNPFVGKPDVKPEIWAYGFRNPYRFSFDSASKQLFAGDVGQDTYEEVDIVNKGANYGWRLTEGNHCYNPATGCDFKGITLPITEYSHREGICVIGGYIYNGKQVSTLKSKYIFADWTGPVFYLQKAGDKWERGNIILKNYPANLKITGFGEDPSGEIYLLTNPDTGTGNTKGAVYKIAKN